MKTSIIVNGAMGKMGSIACKTLAEHPDFELVACLGRHDSLDKAILETNADIVVDLTRADCVYQNTQIIIEHNAHPVIGTSGLAENQIQALRQHCDKKKLGGIIVPNFSIGALLMMRFAVIASTYLPEVEIIEAHHQHKLDAPSGTAIKTAEMIAQARSNQAFTPATPTSPCAARGENCHGIPIHSVRLPGLLAHQQVIFGNAGETLSITHNTIDRSSFMPGLILACQKVKQLQTLYYGLDYLLDDLK